MQMYTQLSRTHSLKKARGKPERSLGIQMKRKTKLSKEKEKHLLKGNMTQDKKGA